MRRSSAPSRAALWLAVGVGTAVVGVIAILGIFEVGAAPQSSSSSSFTPADLQCRDGAAGITLQLPPPTHPPSSPPGAPLPQPPSSRDPAGFASPNDVARAITATEAGAHPTRVSGHTVHRVETAATDLAVIVGRYHGRALELRYAQRSPVDGAWREAGPSYTCDERVETAP